MKLSVKCINCYSDYFKRYLYETVLEYLKKRDRCSHVGAGINQKQKSCPVFWALYSKAPRNWAAFFVLA